MIETPTIYFQLLHEAGLDEALTREISGTEVTWRKDSEVSSEERERYGRILSDSLHVIENRGISGAVSHLELYAQSNESAQTATPTTCVAVLKPSVELGSVLAVFAGPHSVYDEIRRLHGPLGWQFAPRTHDANPPHDYYVALLGPHPRMEAIARSVSNRQLPNLDNHLLIAG